MKKIIYFFFLCSFTFLNAQRRSDHFVVKTNGDTLYGHLKFLTKEGELHNQITVKVSDSLKITLKASEVIYFEEGLAEFLSFIPEGQTQSYFMRIWVIGYFELFEWEVPYSISKTNLIEYRPLLRKKGDTEFIKLDHKKWKKQLAEVLKDYKELADDVKKGRYLMDEMGHIIERYNEWKEDLEDEW